MVADSHLISSFRIGPARPDELDTICEIAKIAWEPIHETMIDALGEDVNPAIDLPEPPLAVLIVGVFTSIAVARRPGDHFRHGRPFPTE